MKCRRRLAALLVVEISTVRSFSLRPCGCQEGTTKHLWYIYIYILATLNTCIGEVFPCLTAESAVASHRFNRKWWCAAFQRLLRDMKKLWINASSGDLGALKFRSLPSRTSVPHLNVHQLQQWTSWVRMLLLYRIWIPLFYHHVPTRYIYMAYIGQHRGMFRKQVVGYSCKGTHIIPLMFSR